jgi:hypothetical protein
MTLPVPIKNQLSATLRKNEAANFIALFWQQSLSPPILEETLEGQTLRIVYCASPLAVREQLTSPPQDIRLILLIPFSDTQLAADIRARLWRNKVIRVDAWENLRSILGVQDIDPRLSKQQWLAEALVEYHAGYKNSVPIGPVLDQETAWRALLTAVLDLEMSKPDAQMFLEWSLDAAHLERYRQLPSALQEAFIKWLTDNHWVVIPALVENGHTDKLLAIGLVASVLYDTAIPASELIFQARGRFTERFFSASKLPADKLQGFIQAVTALAERCYKNRVDYPFAHQLDRAEQILASLDAQELAAASDFLPSGFHQRLENGAILLQKAIKKAQQLPELEHALQQVTQHYEHRRTPHRGEHFTMAVRLQRWLAVNETLQAHSAQDTALNYAMQGGFIDWACSQIWLGDNSEVLTTAYRTLHRKVRERREADNRHFGEQLETVARGDNETARVLYSESVVEKIVAPLAAKHSVLLLVMDGMSMAVFRELFRELPGWQSLQQEQTPGECCALSVLPSLTQSARTSLFAGQLVTGRAANEKKLFENHALLKKVHSPQAPCLLHKAEVMQGGSLAAGAKEKLINRNYRVLGMVLNAIDDQLDGSTQVQDNWHLGQFSLLYQVLNAASEGERIVIITSDHGHVLEQEMKYRKRNTDNERCVSHAEQAIEGEIQVCGKRVLTPDHCAVLPWSESIRYAKSPKTGYHGGGSLQEVVVPLAVFVPFENEIPGWEICEFYPPKWWESVVSVPSVVKATPKKVKAQTQSKQASLFSQTTSTENWLDSLFQSPVYQSQRQRYPAQTVSDEQVRVLLQALAKQGGQLPLTAAAAELNILSHRIRGHLTHVQRVLNVEGYPVLSIQYESKQVKLDIPLLKKQFEL